MANDRPRLAPVRLALSLDEAASSVAVTQTTIRKWIVEGLPAVKIRHRVLIRPESLEAWLRSHETGTREREKERVREAIRRARQ